MKIKKAIEILTLTHRPTCPDEKPDLFDALKLSIEAMKFIEKQRKYHLVFISETLPGETEE